MDIKSDQHEPPVEMRFIDLFTIIIAALVLIIVILALRGIGSERGPEIISKVIPAALLNQRYRVTLAADYGTPPLVWKVVEGSLPRGLELHGDRIEGTPMEAISKRLVVQLQDAKGQRDRAALEIDVHDLVAREEQLQPLAVEAEEIVIPDVVSGQDYSVHLVARGGIPPYRWTVDQGSLPEGLTLQPNGELTGTAEGKHPNAIWMLFSTERTRHQRSREINTARFEAEVTDSQGQRHRQGATMFLEPPRLSFFWQVCLGEFAEQASWRLRGWKALSWVLRILFFIFVAVAALVALVPLKQFLIGYQAQYIEGWTGLIWRPSRERYEISPLIAALAIVISGTLAVLRKLRHFRFPAGGGSNGGDGFYRVSAPIAVPVPVPSGWPEEAAPDEGDESDAGSESGVGYEDEYLNNLKRGGLVRYGGAFLGLSYVRKAELPAVLEEAFQTLPPVGKGLLHTSLDCFLRQLLRLRPRRDAFHVPDARFDVVLARKGPASPVRLKDGGFAPEPNPQGVIIMPSELDPEAQTGDEPEAVLDTLTPRDRSRLEACGIATSESGLRRIINTGAAEQLETAMEAAAAQARRWMTKLLSEAWGQPVRESVLKQILRTRAQVRLEEGTLHVRLIGLRRSKHRRAAEALCDAVNAENPSTLGPHVIPVKISIS